MQKLSVEFKNTPVDTPQVHCSVNSQLNEEETLGVENKVLADNNLDGGQRHTNSQGLQPKVFVISKNGKPLMPTKSSRARKMLKNGKAKVITKYPFTIQLTYQSEEKTQEIKLGIDSGYSFVGFSAISITCPAAAQSAAVRRSRSGLAMARA